MAQHDFDLANQARSLMRTDINNAIAAVISNSSGASSPINPIAFQFWVDTTNNLLKIRNAANNAWITLGAPSLSGLGLLPLAGGDMTGAILAAVGSVGAVGIGWAGDPDSGLYWVSGNVWRFASGGVAYFEINNPLGVTFLGTGSTTLPNGTTAQRPGTPVNGMIRYNTTLNVIEAYINSGWKTILSGVTYPFSTSDFLDTLTNAPQTSSNFSGNLAPKIVPQFPFTSPTLLSNPATIPPNIGFKCSWSPNGEYLAFGSNDSPYILIYKRTANEFLKLSNPATLPNGRVLGLSWSQDSQFLAATSELTPFITIYQRSGDVFTKLANPATLPTGTPNNTSFSNNGELLCVCHDVSPFITIYQRSGTTFTKLTNPATLPPDTASSVAWSINDRFLAIGHASSPYVSIYERSGTTFTKLSNPATLPANPCVGASFSNNGKFLALGHPLTPFITIYERSGTTFTKLTNPATLPATTALEVSFSSSDRYLSVSVDGANPTLVYEVSGSTFTNTGLSVGSTKTNSAQFSNDGQYLAKAITASPYISIYQTASDMAASSVLIAARKNRSGT